MKRLLYYIISMIVFFSSVSCDKWLEATSSSQVSDEKMFSTKSGFHEALTGVYISMASSDCYGRNFTFYANELSAVRYNTVESNAFKIWLQHSFDDVTATACIESMWQSAYFTIANANKILKELERHRGNVMADDWEYNMVRGEMLAVRAFVHFDLMRMFGLAEWTGENSGKLTIPYVTEYTLASTAQKSYADTKSLLLKDIEDALKCLESDPVLGIYPEDFDTNYNADGFWSNRRYHLNYYAVKALAARVLLWAGDYDEAGKYASDVIENSLDRLGIVKWIDSDAEIKKSDNDKKDWSFSSEHIFSLDVNDLYSLTSGYCFGGTDINMTIASEAVEDELFPRDIYGIGNNDGAEDIRGYAMLLKYGGKGYQSYKLYSSSSMAAEYRNRIPMIRISEMYYILAFVSAVNGDLDSMKENIIAVMSHRGYTNVGFDGFSEYDMKGEFLVELSREFLGEGQLFYWYRLYERLKYQSPITIMNNTSGLMYPYPTSETSYGHVQEK